MDNHKRLIKTVCLTLGCSSDVVFKYSVYYCEAQARVRQGSARDGSQGKRSQSLNPSLELTLKLVVTHHHQTFNFT